MHTDPKTLTETEVAQFRRDGFVVVKGAFARADADAMQDDWWRELFDLYGIQRDDRSTWHQPMRDLRRGKSSPQQTKIHTPRLHGVIDDLLGAGAWRWPKNWGRAIATFPQGGSWDVPGLHDRRGPGLWHWDSPVEWHRDGLSAVFAFTFVGAVAPGGGGTSILSGSHRLLQKWDDEMMRGARDVRGQRDWFHRAHPWVAALSGVSPTPADRRKTFMEDGVEIDDIHLRVVELSGEPGDMVLCHPTIVHCVSPNCGAWPRFMRIGTVHTERFIAWFRALHRAAPS
jgi:hypothetical protein